MANAANTAQLKPSSNAEQSIHMVRLAPFRAGFERAIATLQGGVPAHWSDRENAAHVLAESIPRITVVRLIAWGKESQTDLEVVAARVLTDMVATEPGLLELTPEEAAIDGMALMQSMWPQGAFIPRNQYQPDSKETKQHPTLDKLRKLSAQWHRLSVLPAEQAKTKGPAAWRQKIISDIALAKAEALREGLSRKEILTALDSSGDRWVWEIPPPARDFYLDEFGQAPQGTEVSLAAFPA